MPQCNDFASQIPQTVVRSDTIVSSPLRNPHQWPRAAHYVFPLYDIGLGRFAQPVLIGPADRVRVVCQFPLNIQFDSGPMIETDSLQFPTQVPNPQPNPTFFPAAGGTQTPSGAAVALMPVCDFTLEQPIQTIRITPPSRNLMPTGWVGDEVTGACHVFVASGPVDRLDFGPWIPHCALISVPDVGGAVWFSNPIRPTLHGDDTAAPIATGFAYLPSKTELTGFSLNFSFGGAGVVTDFTLLQAHGVGAMVLGRWFPGLAVWDHELNIPIEFCPWQCRSKNGAAPGALQLAINASGIWDGGQINLRFRSSM